MSSWTYVYIFPFKLFDSKWNLYCWNYEKWIQLYFSYMTIQLFECHLLINSHVFHWHKISVLKKKNNIPIYLGCPTFSLQFHWYVNSWVLFHITLALYYFFKYLYFITVKNCITIFRVWWLMTVSSSQCTFSIRILEEFLPVLFICLYSLCVCVDMRLSLYDEVSV